MQVFLPYPSYTKTAKCLDNKRLGNQCYRECLTLIRGYWPNHLVSKMWANHKHSLCLYAAALAEEMQIRGAWKPEIAPKWKNYFLELSKTFENTGKPEFVGNKKFHDSHKSNLLRKDPVWYGQFNWKVNNNLEYVWPL